MQVQTGDNYQKTSWKKVMANSSLLLERKQAGDGYEVTSSQAHLKKTLSLGHPNHLMKCFPREQSAPLDRFHVGVTQRFQEVAQAKF